LSDVLAIVAGMELWEWAGISGVGRLGAAWWLHAGVLPVPARELAAGTMLVGAPEQAVAGVAVCARVLSCGRRPYRAELPLAAMRRAEAA
jgi:putative resolvase